MADLAVSKGLYFEDYNVGDTASTQGRTITEADIVNFAALTGDWNSIHVDKEYAGKGMFGERIAHGLLVLSIASGLTVQLGYMRDTVLAFMGIDEWRFKSVVKIGDTIVAHATVLECRNMRRLGGGLVTFDVQILNQNGQIVQQGKQTVLVKSRPAAE